MSDEAWVGISNNAVFALIILLISGGLFKQCQWDHEERLYKLQHPTEQTSQVHTGAKDGKD